MTVDFVIDGRGGGSGHLVRSLNLYKVLRQSGQKGLIFATGKEPILEFLTEDERPVVSTSLDTPVQADTLYQDTFAEGFKGKPLSGASFNKRVLVARYNRKLVPHDLVRFDEVLQPYPSNQSEWPKHFSDKMKAVGFLVSPRIRLLAEKRMLAILDPMKALKSKGRYKILQTAKALSMPVKLYDKMTTEIEGSHILSVGAGYNCFYELIQLGANARFLPIPKRYDDQFRRVEMYNNGVKTHDEFCQWLETEQK